MPSWKESLMIKNLPFDWLSSSSVTSPASQADDILDNCFAVETNVPSCLDDFGQFSKQIRPLTQQAVNAIEQTVVGFYLRFS
jgi:hypothetical protein